MRYLDQSNAFKKDLKRVGKGIYRSIVNQELRSIVDSLRKDEILLPKYRDHPLHGGWEGSRDCHIKPDLILIYTYIDDDVLRLERLGSHAELFGM